MSIRSERSQKDALVFSDIDDTLRQGLLLQELCPEFNKFASAQIDLPAFNDAIYRYNNGEPLAAKVSLETCYQELKDVAISRIQDISSAYVRDTAEHFYHQPLSLLALLQNYADIYLLTSEPAFVTDGVVKYLHSKSIEIKDTHSTHFETRNGVFTGTTEHVTFAQKATAVNEILEVYDHPRLTVALCDNLADLPMLESVAQPIAVVESRHSHFLRQVALERKWSILFTQHTS